MIEQSYIRLPSVRLTDQCERRLAHIRSLRAQLWRDEIDRLNARRAKRWFGDRSPLSDEDAKHYTETNYRFPPPWSYSIEEQRLKRLLQMALDAPLDHDYVYLSTDDHKLLYPKC